MAGYLRLRCNLPPNLEDELPSLMASAPTLGVEVEGSGAEGSSVAIFTDAADVEALSLLAGVLTDHGATDVRIERYGEHDWLQRYRDEVRPFAVGNRWWIDPHPENPSRAPRDRQRLVIEPRTAFGSGSHESTQLMLVALEQAEIAGADVLDVGTGSGILALAAEHLGAQTVVGLDVDPTAVWVARQMSARQEWKTRVQYILGSVASIGSAHFQVVLCNMISTNFRPLLDDMARILASDGHLILAGLLASETDIVTEALLAVGLETTGRNVLGEWASLCAMPAER